MLSAINIPVTTADKSAICTVFFRHFCVISSVNTQAPIHTAKRAIALVPKK